MVLVAVHNSDITGFIATTHLGVIKLPNRSFHVVVGFVFNDSIVATKDTVSYFTRLSHEVLQILLVETTKKSIDFAVGDTVEIIDGPLMGSVGVVKEIDADNLRVKVEVSMFGRDTLSELDLLRVKPI